MSLHTLEAGYFYHTLYTQLWRLSNPEKYKRRKKIDVKVKAKRYKTDPAFRKRQVMYTKKYQQKNEDQFRTYQNFLYWFNKTEVVVEKK
jgi:hypothetical protein